MKDFYVHIDPPVPADVRGGHCGQLGVGPHIDVIPRQDGDEPRVAVSVYLSGYTGWSDTYRRDLGEPVVVRPPGPVMRLLGDSLDRRIQRAVGAAKRRLDRYLADLATVVAVQ